VSTEQGDHPESVATEPAPMAGLSRVMRAGAIIALFAATLAIGAALPGWVHGGGPAGGGIRMAEPGRGSAPIIPVPKGAKELRAMTGRRNTRNSVRWYGVSMPEARVMAFYDHVMKKKGWRLIHSLPPTPGMPGRQFRYSNAAGDLCTILITMNDDGCRIGIVCVSAAGSPRP
jgi:hypothetical protein